MKTITLSEKELETVMIFDRIKNRELTQEEAAKILKISTRQARRRVKRYNAEGAAGLVHKGRNQQSNRAIKAPIIEEILKTIESKYLHLKDKAGPTFLADQLKKTDGFVLDHETLRRLMIKNGLWIVSRKKRQEHQWRERKHHRGELVQVDGSLHVWFGAGYAMLIAFIDDATSEIVWAEFVDYESTKNLACLTHDYIKQRGRPMALYTDRGGTYKVNNNKDGQRHITQYARMLQEVDIDLIHARSPQAKGRIERLFKTLQDRLVKELELAGITGIDAANVYLKNVYIPDHNTRFAVQPKEKADFHRPIDMFNLHSIFCLKFERIINNDYTICFKDSWFQLGKKQSTFIRRGQKVMIHKHFDGTIDIIRNGHRLEFKKVVKQIPCIKQAIDDDTYPKSRAYRKPPASHPWRTFKQWSDKKPDISTEFSSGHF